MDIVESIGHTPLVELRRVNPNPKVRVLAKLEGNNPGGSVKDRAALYMIDQAERSGQLTRDKVILEPTSGNTGIALAMIGAAKGYRVKLTLPGCVSSERKRTLEAYGAEVVVTCPHEGTDGAIRMAQRILEQEPGRYFMPNQFANPANPQAHYETTGPEIWEQTSGEVDVLVAGMGTTGTLMGVSRCLREKRPQVRIVGVEPMRGHAIQGLKNMSESIVPSIYEPGLLDGKLVCKDDDAFELFRDLAIREGLFCGLSSGAALWGAREVARNLPRGSTVVVLFPDRGDRYLSTEAFRSICALCPP